jgi:hypothetical protein
MGVKHYKNGFTSRINFGGNEDVYFCQFCYETFYLTSAVQHIKNCAVNFKGKSLDIIQSLYDIFLYLVGIKNEINPFIEIDDILIEGTVSIYMLLYNIRFTPLYTHDCPFIIRIMAKNLHESLFHLTIPLFDWIQPHLSEYGLDSVILRNPQELTERAQFVELEDGIIPAVIYDWPIKASNKACDFYN